MDPVKIGVIGLRFGRHHVETLANMPGVRIAALADRGAGMGGELDAYAARYGAKAYREGVALIQSEPLDAVSLCVSPRARRDLILAAAERGVPMFVEKPWAPDMEQALDLGRLCAQRRARVMVGFSFRYHPAIVRLRELIGAGLGRPLMLSGQYVFNWLPARDSWLWKPDGGNGFFNENSCHLFDSACSLLGAPRRVYAETANVRGSPGDEIAALTIRFAGGAIAAFTVGALGARGFDAFPRLDLIADAGQAQLLGRHHVWDQLRWSLRSEGVMRTFDADPEQLSSTRYTHAFNHFLECVRAGTEPSCGIADGVRAVAIAQAIGESARTGRPVELALPAPAADPGARTASTEFPSSGVSS